MPELPEVEAVVENLRREGVRGARIRRVDVFHEKITAPQPSGLIHRARRRRIERIGRRGKNIVLGLSGGLWLRVHLGMTGNLRLVPDARFRSMYVRWNAVLDDGRGLALEDSRVLGRIHLYSKDELEGLLAKLGIEPLTPDFRAERVVELARNSRQPVKLFLMDQSRIAGLGNIYAAEALHRAGIDPRREARSISRSRLLKLSHSIETVLRDAVQSALIAYRTPGTPGEAEFFERAVYGREGEPCRVCGARIRRFAQGGRSTYCCFGCQR
jgi:formamidopyrimidine-DNA glycosylase